MVEKGEEMSSGTISIGKDPDKFDRLMEKILRVAQLILWLSILAFALYYCGYCKLAHANDYTIKAWGQDVFSIEHDGVIHIQGK